MIRRVQVFRRAVLMAFGATTGVLFLVVPPVEPSGDGDPIWSSRSSPDLISGCDQTSYNEQSGAPVVVPSPDEPGRSALQFTVP